MDSKSFHLEQYKMLREEIMQYIRDLYHAQLAAAIGTGTVYTWLLLHKTEASSRLIWFVGPCLILICGIRSIDLSIRIKAIAKYLRSIEEEILGPDAKIVGWERSKSFGPFDTIAIVVASIFWVLGIIASIIASCLLSK